MRDNRFRMLAGALLAVMASAAPAMANPASGSGTVEFRFTSFFGPYELSFPSGFQLTGTVNGVTPTQLGSPIATGSTSGATWTVGTVGATTSGGTFPLTGTPTTMVTLVDDPVFYDPNFETKFTWAPAAFTNVAVGDQFTLGTLTFQNGAWFGGGATAALNVPTRLGFRVTTTSASGAVFNQSRSLGLIHTVHAPFNNDTTTLGGQEAAADWVTLIDTENGTTLNTFRVFDRNQTPAGFTNTGSIDLIGRFGSLDILGFGNPVGGFLTEGADPLPTVPLPGGGGGGGVDPVPEPGSWALLIAGFGMVGAALRRRRLAMV